MAYGNAHRCMQGAARSGTHLLRRRDRRGGALLEPAGDDVGERLLDGDVGLAHALVARLRLLAAAARRSRFQELRVVRGRRHCERRGLWVAPGYLNACMNQAVLPLFSGESKGARKHAEDAGVRSTAIEHRPKRPFGGGQPQLSWKRPQAHSVKHKWRAVYRPCWRCRSATNRVITGRRMPMTPWKLEAAFFA